MPESNPASKPCRDCGEVKPLDDFPIQKGGRHRRHPVCKACRAAAERLRYAARREQILAASRLDPARMRRVRWRSILRKYGVTREEYEAMFARQCGACVICHRLAVPLLVDHDHITGVVRGLLCTRCNFGIAGLHDDPELCVAGAEYLERFR